MAGNKRAGELSDVSDAKRSRGMEGVSEGALAEAAEAPGLRGAALSEQRVKDALAAVEACVRNRNTPELSLETQAAAAVMFRGHTEVEALLLQRLPGMLSRRAAKVLEQLWLEVMQSPDAFENPFRELAASDALLQGASERWARQLPQHPGVWREVLALYEEKAAGFAAAAAEMAAALGDAGDELAFRVDLTGNAVMAEPAVVWPELSETCDPKHRESITRGFDGPVLQWRIRGGDVLLTRPLVNDALVTISKKAGRHLAVHSLVYGSMFVAGQAMGLAQSFHDALHREPWACPDRRCVAFEMYAHLVNRRSAPHPFLSMVPKADGAVGRVQDLSLDRLVDHLADVRLPGVLFCNPPYVEAIMDRDLPNVVAAVQKADTKGVVLTVITLLPDWMDNGGVAAVVGSPHVRSHWHLRKGEHRACTQSGTQVTMKVSQRLCLLSTDPDARLSPSLFETIAMCSQRTPRVPRSMVVV